MSAETLNCPMCGASASSASTKCLHCGARLATVSCPSCFGMMFLGAKFCSHCGAKANRTEKSATSQPCPRCRVELDAVIVGETELRECPRCEGIWADADSLARICSDREQQAAVLGVAAPMPTDLTGSPEVVRYVPCPDCQKLMHRVNFAKCSHVVVDVCKPHGTWFDKDELRRIVEFIRAGGFEKARSMEIRELERQRRQLQAARTASPLDTGSTMRIHHADSWEPALSAAASVLDVLFD